MRELIDLFKSLRRGDVPLCETPRFFLWLALSVLGAGGLVIRRQP